MFDQCPNEKVGIIYYLLLDYPRQMNVIVGKYGNYETGIVSECRGRCKNAPSCSVNLLWVCLKISMLGIGVCKRKYADTPLRRSLCLRQNTVMPNPVFTPTRRYADRCVYAKTLLRRTLCLRRYAVTPIAVFMPICRYANCCVCADTPLRRSLCLR